MELTFANHSSLLCSPVPQSVDFHLDKILINVLCARTLSLKFIAINFTAHLLQQHKKKGAGMSVPTCGGCT